MTEKQLSTPRLSTELDAIRKWREERESSYRRDLNQIDEEDNRLHQKLAEIQRKLSDNSQLREQVLSQLHQLPVDEGRRSHNVLLESLKVDKALVAERTAALQAAIDRQQDDLKKKLADPENASMIDEFEKFSEIEPLLASMPASYRKVVLDHHEHLRANLAPLFELANGAPPPLDLSPAPTGVICSVDPEEGVPTAFAVIAPVEYAVYRDWASRGQDLQTVLCYSVVTAISLLLQKIGAPNAPVAFRNYEDCLAIQVWLGNQNVKGDLRELATDLVEGGSKTCPDIAAAALDCQVVWVSPFTIAPDEDMEIAPQNDDASEVETPPEEGDIEVEEGDENPEDPNAPRPVQIILRRGGPDADEF